MIKSRLQIDGISGKRYNYDHVVKQIQCVASGLFTLGVRRGDVLAIVSPNSVEYVYMMFGALAAGASVTTINPNYSARKYMLKALKCTSEYSPRTMP